MFLINSKKNIMKLTEKQQHLVDTLKKYPKDMIMSHNGSLTGGHGVKFDKRTIESLKRKGIIMNGKLKTESEEEKVNSEKNNSREPLIFLEIGKRGVGKSFLSNHENIMLDNFKKKISELESKRDKILTDFKENKVGISTDNIIRLGKELELIRAKIWGIEEAIHQ